MSQKTPVVADPEIWLKQMNGNAFVSFAQSQVDFIMAKDRHSLMQQAKRLGRDINQNQKSNLQNSLHEWLAKAELSRQEFSHRKESIPAIEYPELPVTARRAEIIEAIQQHQVLIVAGETGSGKTTQLPKLCIEAGRGFAGMIGHTQPRRLAARSVAQRIAEEVKTTLGDSVGFKIRFSDQVSSKSIIKLMTDGILLAEMQHDRFLSEYDTIIIDEAHERSLNIDFLLGYIKQLLPKRPDLKVIITSATIDPERFSKHFDNAPIIEVSGRTYPVELRYKNDEEFQRLEQSEQIVSAVDELLLEKTGDILVFLSGEREIRDAQQILMRQNYRNTEVIPLYARLSASEQNKVFKPQNQRRIILATNVAETSLTVPGIKYVIDTGYVRISRYSVRSKVQRLPIEPISQASANQRAGRCGRVSEGICIRLYSEDDYLSRPEFTEPEILRTNLASVILQMMALKLGKIEHFPFVESPEQKLVKDGYRLLEELQALETNNGRMQLTQVGKRMAKLPVDPKFGRMIIAAESFNAVKETAIIAAGLSIQDPRERPQDFKQKADECHAQYAEKSSDFISLLNLWNLFTAQQKQISNNQLRKWCKAQFIHYLRMREWQDVVSQIKQSLSNVGIGQDSHDAHPDMIHQSLLTGLLSQLGMKNEDGRFLGARNTTFSVFPGSVLARKPPKWLMSSELVETSKLFARVNASIACEWIEPAASHLVKRHYSEPHWSKRRGSVMAYEKVTLYGIPIVAKRLINYSNIDRELCRHLFIQQGLVNGQTQLNIKPINDNMRLLEEADEIEKKTRKRSWLANEEDLIEFYAEKLPAHVVSESSFKKWWRGNSSVDLLMTENDVYKQQPSKQIATDFPEYWSQGRIKLPIEYHFEPGKEIDGATVQVPLPLLNQLVADGFDWHVPGLLEDKVIALIKSLPKKLRRNFVPAPNYAQACLLDIQPFDKAGKSIRLTEALALKLFRMTGVKVLEEDWQTEQLDQHLRIHFAVIDDKKKTLASGDNLIELQRKMRGEVETTFSNAATPELERKGLTTWDLDTLPETFMQQHGGFELKAFPALVSKGQSVNIELCDSEQTARDLHRQGVATLLKLAMPSPVKYLQDELSNQAKLALYFNPFGQLNKLIDDCITAAILELMDEFSNGETGYWRQRVQFDNAKKKMIGEVNPRVLTIAELVEKGLRTANTIQKQLKGKVPLNLIQSFGYVQSHLQTLVYPGFVSALGGSRLPDWIRYLQALEKRLEKIKIDPARDRVQQQVLDKLQQEIDKVAKRYPVEQAKKNFEEVKWMQEELRVSLFAQQLGTRYPISVKRIQKHLHEMD